MQKRREMEMCKGALIYENYNWNEIFTRMSEMSVKTNGILQSSSEEDAKVLKISI